MQAPESVSSILQPVTALFAMKVIETNLAWYMSEGLLSKEVGSAVPQQIRCATQKLVCEDVRMSCLTKKKMYAIRRHGGSLCTQRRPKIAAPKAASSKADLWGFSP